MNNRLRLAWVPLLVAAAGIGLSGCKEQGGDTRNIIDVQSLNNNSPLMSDVYNYGTKPNDPIDDFIPVDVVEVTFVDRPHDPAITVSPGDPFGSVHFTSYDLVFEDPNHADGLDLDGDGTVDLKNFRGAMNVRVPINGSAEGFVLVMPGGYKIIPPVSCLGPQGGGCVTSSVEFGVIVKLTFHGEEETSGDAVDVTRELTVRIGQFADN